MVIALQLGRRCPELSSKNSNNLIFHLFSSKPGTLHFPGYNITRFKVAPIWLGGMRAAKQVKNKNPCHNWQITPDSAYGEKGDDIKRLSLSALSTLSVA